jgi:glycosyltransferase involved in cell wall biosynthesis
MISIIIPCYDEEGNVVPLYLRLRKVLEGIGDKWEIIFIDDGSTDNTFRILEGLNKKDKRVRIIKFRRNFGQTAAMDAGFKHAKGEIIIPMDADLQNDPRDIPRLIAKINEGYDVVSGWRYKRKDPITKKIFSRIADILRRLLTGVKIHDSGCTLKAYKKECFDGLDLYGEMHRSIPALLFWKGFKIGEIKIMHHKRLYGKTKYNLKRVIKGFLDLLVVVFWQRYSARPIHLFGGVGLLTGFVGFIIALYLTIMKLLYNQSIANRPLLLLAVLLIILGVQFLVFGVLADIMVKLYYGKDRRNYNIEKIIE